jgi:hypothetical protein
LGRISEAEARGALLLSIRKGSKSIATLMAALGGKLSFKLSFYWPIFVRRDDTPPLAVKLSQNDKGGEIVGQFLALIEPLLASAINALLNRR